MIEPKGLKVRVLGIDPGTRRMGLAVSDELGITAQGIETFEVGGKIDFIDYLSDLIKGYNIGVIVLGMPRAMGGGDIEGTERSRELAETIRRDLHIEVHLRDERMTSLEAEKVLRKEGRIREAGDIDRLSAVLLLQSYLDETSE